MTEEVPSITDPYRQNLYKLYKTEDLQNVYNLTMETARQILDKNFKKGDYSLKLGDNLELMICSLRQELDLRKKAEIQKMGQTTITEILGNSTEEIIIDALKLLRKLKKTKG